MLFRSYKAGTKVERGENLFPRLDIEAEVEELKKTNKELFETRQAARLENSKVQEETINIDDFDKVKIRAGKVLACENHPDADKLLVFQVDFGNEKRQIVSGIKKHYKAEDLIGKTVIAVTNLEPVKLRGVESNGMILSAEDEEGNLSVLTTLGDIEAGAGVK